MALKGIQASRRIRVSTLVNPSDCMYKVQRCIAHQQRFFTSKQQAFIQDNSVIDQILAIVYKTRGLADKEKNWVVNSDELSPHEHSKRRAIHGLREVHNQQAELSSYEKAIQKSFDRYKEIKQGNFSRTKVKPPAVPLPVDVKDFLQHLEYSTSRQEAPTSAELELIFSKVNNAEIAVYILERAFEFEHEFTECRGHLVSSRGLGLVLLLHIQAGRVNDAERLLMRAQDHHGFALTSRLIETVLRAYKEQSTQESVSRIASMIASLETYEASSGLLNTYMYNIQMDAYAAVVKSEKTLTCIAKIIHKMRQSSNYDMHPNRRSYSTLIKALVRCRAPGFAMQVQGIVKDLEKDPRLIENQEQMTYFYTLAIDAWTKSGEDEAVSNARKLFQSILEPSEVCCNVMLNLYVEQGFLEEAVSMFDTIKTKFGGPSKVASNTLMKLLRTCSQESEAHTALRVLNALESPDTEFCNVVLSVLAKEGDYKQALALLKHMQTETRPDCGPDTRSYNTVLNSLKKSNEHGVLQVAERVFRSVIDPNTITFNTLLSMYAYRSSKPKYVRLAIDLVRQQQSAFDAGKNCCPDKTTKQTLLNAIDFWNKGNLDVDAKDVLEWFRRQETMQGKKKA
jgi:pentatricopeptide repeat protein